MTRVNRDTIVAIALLVATGVLFVASFDIRNPDYGQLSPSTWPRIILGILTVLELIYLLQSVKQGTAGETGAPAQDASPADEGLIAGILGLRNIFWCFALFLVYLLVLPWLGMLVGGMVFVFLLLTVLGGWTPRLLALHAAIAVLTVGGMWSLFTYGLGVFLPQGELFGTF
ncbi:MAG TPA: tripartite tricarboxylate transporter TctB family protein [Paracoccaceae bacterium]|nr:tripartite tricarboxylate transporter TctB family protein [Paracoccaceae bacterium]